MNSYNSKGITKIEQFRTEEGFVRWREKEPEPILLCACGKKYIKTRLGQERCLFCLMKKGIGRAY